MELPKVSRVFSVQPITINTTKDMLLQFLKSEQRDHTVADEVLTRLEQVYLSFGGSSSSIFQNPIKTEPLEHSVENITNYCAVKQETVVAVEMEPETTILSKEEKKLAKSAKKEAKAAKKSAKKEKKENKRKRSLESTGSSVKKIKSDELR